MIKATLKGKDGVVHEVIADSYETVGRIADKIGCDEWHAEVVKDDV